MRIALAQIDTTQGDIAGNAERILDAAGKAARGGAELAVFPELALPGYCPRDLLYSRRFVDAAERALQRIAAGAPPIDLLVGTVVRNDSGRGRALFNSAAWVSGGRVAGFRHKSLLPNYDVFDEARYFEPAPVQEPLTIAGRRVGVTICEDIWIEPLHGEVPVYTRDPASELVAHGAEFLVNLSASPFATGKRELREGLCTRTARRLQRPLVLVNLVGGNDEVIFDGSSVVADARGRTIGRAPSFAEDVTLVDIDADSRLEPLPTPSRESETRDVLDALVLGLRDYAAKCGFTQALIGLSGGIDSAVTAALAILALGPKNVFGVAMPSKYSSEESLEDARELAGLLGIHLDLLPIDPVFTSFLATLGDVFAGRPADVTEENLQARIRGVLLMALSNKFRRLLLTTGNKSEMAVGYCTLYGDMCGGLSVISDVPKTLVYRLADLLNAERRMIPERSITKPPSAELRVGQKDTDSLPPYDVLDPILRLHVEEMKTASEIIALGYDRTTVDRVVAMVARNEYKRRQAPPGLRVTTKAFGIGRRMPIAGRTTPALDL